MKLPQDPRAIVLLLATAGACWYGMMVVHESGHVVAGWLSGGRVSGVVLHPFGFSRTDLSENPWPMFVAAAGAVWGSLLPVAAWLVARAARFRFVSLVRAFAGFCLLVNGAYLASVVILPAGDTADLLRLGVPMWMIVVPGLAGFACGLALFNGLGEDFGFGDRPVEKQAVVAAVATFTVLFAAMSLWTFVL